MEHHDDIGGLLDLAGLAQVGQDRRAALVLGPLTVQLSHRHHRHMQLLGEVLEVAGHLVHLLAAIRAPVTTSEQLQVVDDDQPEAAPAGQVARLLADVVDGLPGLGRHVDERAVPHGSLGPLEVTLVLGLWTAGDELVEGDLRHLGQGAGGYLVGGHLHGREEDVLLVAVGEVPCEVLAGQGLAAAGSGCEHVEPVG